MKRQPAARIIERGKGMKKGYRVAIGTMAAALLLLVGYLLLKPYMLNISFGISDAFWDRRSPGLRCGRRRSTAASMRSRISGRGR